MMFKNPQVAAFHASYEVDWAKDMSLTLAEQRRLQEAGRADSQLAPGCTFERVDMNGVGAERIVPPSAPTDRAILYLHGGGHIMGSMVTHRQLCSHFAVASGLQLFNVDFRLAPEHPYPADLEDAESAYRGALASGLAPERIVIAGDSGGANSAAALVLKIRELDLPMPAGCYLLSPMLDMQAKGASYDTVRELIVTRAGVLKTAKLYLAGHADTIFSSPIRADLFGFPPTYIHVSSEEAFLSETLEFATKAALAKVEVHLCVEPEMPHAWPLFIDKIDVGYRTIEEAGKWMRSIVSRAT
jgi:monoterpene epsilon-lactone hydrolase